MGNKKIAVTLGKFIPFHAGHESIIRQMYADGFKEIIVCVYEHEEYGINLKTRVRWIKEIFEFLYADIIFRVVELKNPPKEEGYTESAMKAQEDFFEKEMKYNGINPYEITHFYCSEPYVEHMCKRFHWKGVSVDNLRDDIKISGTKIRENFKEYYKYLHPIVQKDMPKLVTVLGGESTGKTTLSKALSNEFNLGYIPEYGAEYWAEHNTGGVLTLNDIDTIKKEHNRRRNKAIENANNKVYIEDTNNLTTDFFGRFYGAIGKLDGIDEELVKEMKKTDLFILCKDDIPFDPSNGRVSKELRETFNEMYLAILMNLKCNFIIVSGSLDERIAQSMKAIEKL